MTTTAARGAKRAALEAQRAAERAALEAQRAAEHAAASECAATHSARALMAALSVHVKQGTLSGCNDRHASVVGEALLRYVDTDEAYLDDMERRAGADAYTANIMHEVTAEYRSSDAKKYREYEAGELVAKARDRYALGDKSWGDDLVRKALACFPSFCSGRLS